MQLILAAFVFISSTTIMYIYAKLALAFYEETASRKQKLIFAFLTGTLMQTTFIYVAYLIGGAVSFSPLYFALITTSNPIFAFLYYFIGIKILKLAPLRSVRVMCYIYLYYCFILNLGRLVGSAFFVQTTERYNYVIDALQQILYYIVILLICLLTFYLYKRRKFSVRISDKVFLNIKKELAIYFLKACFIYGVSITFIVLIPDTRVAYLVISLVLGLFLFGNLVYDNSVSASYELENRNVHINALSKGISEFSVVKHDFYNILQTYGGYLDVGEYEKLKEYHASLLKTTTRAGSTLDLSRRLPDNPPLVSLLMSKTEFAESKNIEMNISIKGGIKNLYIDNMDMCRCIASLLDNAIESAIESNKHEILFALEEKPGGSKLIIITNSTASHVDTQSIVGRGVTSKSGHQGMGLYNVRKILEKYGNCTFQISYYNNEFSSYIEMIERA